MSVISSPPRPGFAAHDRIQALKALIEEARRRARRRRRLTAACVLLALVAVGGFVNALRGRGGLPESTGAAPIGGVVAEFDGSPLRPGGGLTVIGGPGFRLGKTADGWYGLSTLVGPGCVAGCLEPLVRCPERARWCGHVLSVDWSRDGTRLAFSVTSFASANPYNGIHVVDVATGRDRQLADVGGDPFNLALSPDGAHLAYVRNGRIYLTRTDGKDRHELRTGTAGPDSSPAWSPDGSRIALATRVSDDQPASIYLVGLDGSGRRLLARGGSDPAWSPDGQTIAYTARCGRIKLMTPRGRDVTPASVLRRCRVIGVPGRATWSPDGSSIAVAAAGGVYLMQRDGTRLTLATDLRSGNVSGGTDLSWGLGPSDP